MNSNIRLTVVGAVLLLSISASSAARECTLDCPVDAPCTFGDAIFSHSNTILDAVQLETTSFDGMHCACPPGWTGILCDHKFETCSDSHDCFHGGECAENEYTDAFGNPQLLCDCSNAQTSTAADGIRYVGKYCETPFEKSCATISSNTNNNEDADHDTLFCVNGGDCNPNFE
jgi:hypothetical protein